MTKISTTKQETNIIWSNFIKVMEKNCMYETQMSESNVQIPKCNHLGDGVRYSPSEVIASKISACQGCI